MTASINELGANLADIGDRVKREIELSAATREQILAAFGQLRKTVDDFEKAMLDELLSRQDSLDELLNGDKAA